jgi:hypothetical protein
MDWRHCPRGKVVTWQAESPDFKHKTHLKKKKSQKVKIPLSDI